MSKMRGSRILDHFLYPRMGYCWDGGLFLVVECNFFG